MDKIEYLSADFEEPIIKGTERRALIQPYLEFKYSGKELTIPCQIGILLIFTGEEFGFDFSFSIRMLSYFKINNWLSTNDMHSAHLKLIGLLQGYLNKSTDNRLRDVKVPIPTLEQSIILMGSGGNVLNNFIINFASN